MHKAETTLLNRFAGNIAGIDDVSLVKQRASHGFLRHLPHAPGRHLTQCIDRLIRKLHLRLVGQGQRVGHDVVGDHACFAGRRRRDVELAET